MAFTLRVPRPVRAALAVVVLLALVGTTYQGVTTSLERRSYRHPGRLVDVGGHQLHIHCTGAGTPIVVLEAPAAGVSVGWMRVQEALTRVTRVCSYDRAGLGWSERGDGPFDPARVPDELRALLTGAREPAPYVVAGQGLGAAFAAAFGSRFPDITAGVVLFDAPSSGSASLDHNSLGGMPRAMPWLARVGLLRIVNAGTRNVDPVSRAFMNRPDHLTRAALELAKWDDAVRLIPEAAAGRPAPPARGLTTTAALPAPPQSEEGATAATTAIRQALQKARRR